MEDRWGWVAAALAAVPAALAAWLNRKGAKEQREGDWREKGQQALFEQQGEQLKAAYKRREELEVELARLEADRDRGWGLARAWFDRAHEERHRHINTLQIAMNGPAHDGDMKARAPDPLPAFQAIAPKNGNGP